MEVAVYQNGSKRLRPSKIYKPRTWRWLNGKQVTGKSIVKATNREKAFYFRPYSYTPRGITSAQLFEQEREENSLEPQEAFRLKSRTLMTIFDYIACSGTLRISSLVWDVIRSSLGQRGCSTKGQGESGLCNHGESCFDRSAQEPGTCSWQIMKSLLGEAIPGPTKARDHFLQIKKKIAPTMNLEARARWASLAMNQKSQPPEGGLPKRKGRGMVLAH